MSFFTSIIYKHFPLTWWLNLSTTPNNSSPFHFCWTQLTLPSVEPEEKEKKVFLDWPDPFRHPTLLIISLVPPAGTEKKKEKLWVSKETSGGKVCMKQAPFWSRREYRNWSSRRWGRSASVERMGGGRAGTLQKNPIFYSYEERKLDNVYKMFFSINQSLKLIPFADLCRWATRLARFFVRERIKNWWEKTTLRFEVTRPRIFAVLWSVKKSTMAKIVIRWVTNWMENSSAVARNLISNLFRVAFQRLHCRCSFRSSQKARKP